MNINRDEIFTYTDGDKIYVIYYCVSYNESSYEGDANDPEYKCFKHEYTDPFAAKSVKDAIKFAKETIPIYLKFSSGFYRDKKNVKLDSIEEVYVRTVYDEEEQEFVW